MSHKLWVQKLTQTVIERPIATLFFRSSLHFFVPKMIIVRSSASSMTKPDIANIPETRLTKCPRLWMLTRLKKGNGTCIEWSAAEFADVIPKKPLSRFTIGYAKTVVPLWPKDLGPRLRVTKGFKILWWIGSCCVKYFIDQNGNPVI